MIKNGHTFIKFNINEKPLFIFLEHNQLDHLVSYCRVCNKKKTTTAAATSTTTKQQHR